MKLKQTKCHTTNLYLIQILLNYGTKDKHMYKKTRITRLHVTSSATKENALISNQTSIRSTMG